jgi:hypothetical protein
MRIAGLQFPLMVPSWPEILSRERLASFANGHTFIGMSC